MPRTLPPPSAGAFCCVLLWASAAAPAAAPQAAYEAIRAADWQAADQLYTEILDANPYYTHYWLNRGYARMHLERCDTALEDFSQALRLGGARQSVLYYTARCQALLDRPQAALTTLAELARAGYDRFDRALEDEAFQVLRENPEFQRLTMTLDLSGLDRVPGWRGDLSYLDQLIRERHVRPFHTLAETQWAAGVAALHADIPDLDDTQVIGRMIELAASVGDGHTVIYAPLEGRFALGLAPVRPYWFGEELYVRAASVAHADWVGARIDTIGGLPTRAAFERILPLLNRDNAMTPRWFTEFALRIVEVYYISGLSQRPDQVVWGLTLPDGSQQEVTVRATPLMDDPMARSLPEGWVDAAGDELPLWRRRPDDFYWFEYLPGNDLVYFQFNQIRDQGETALAEFVTQLLAFIDGEQVQTLVIDIRQNNGGNSHLNPGLMIPLAAHPIAREEGRLFVIIGRRTFSAAQNLASDLDRETRAIFVGESTGSRPNFYGEDHQFRLPYSGLTGSVSTRYWQGGITSDDDRIWIAPHIAAEPNFSDYRDGRDPALTAILEELNR